MKNKHNLLSILNVFLLSVGSIIGVGFLSGSEIWSFFTRFGETFFYVLPFMFVLLFFGCYKILKKSEIEDKYAKMYNFHKNNGKNANLMKLKLTTIFFNIEMLLCSAAMFSGLKNIIFELLKNNQIFIFVIMVVFVLLVLLKGFGSISKINILIMISFFIIIIILLGDVDVFNKNTFKSLSLIKGFNITNFFGCFFLSVLYVFMNLSHIVPIFQKQDICFSRKGKIVFSVLFSFLLCLLIFFLVLFLGVHSYLSASEMPILNYFKSQSNKMIIFYVIVLVGCLLSSLLVCLMGLKRMVETRIKTKFKATYTVVLLSLILGFLPFNFFINFVYPFIGILNLITLIFL